MTTQEQLKGTLYAEGEATARSLNDIINAIKEQIKEFWKMVAIRQAVNGSKITYPGHARPRPSGRYLGFSITRDSELRSRIFKGSVPKNRTHLRKNL
jgi:hypothetical protein